MAESDATKTEPAAEKSKFPLKTILILVGVLLVEAVLISGAFLLAGGPADVKGDSTANDKAREAELPVEQLVVSEKFQNTKTGRTYLYDTEIYMVVRQKHHEEIKKELERNKILITTEIATIFRQAEPTHLLEPTLATITRQIKAKLDEHFPPEEEGGQPRVEKVLIRKCNQFKADL